MPQLCPRHGARQGRAPGAILGHRASRLAPYRHYTREFRMRIIRTMRPRAPRSCPAAVPHTRVPLPCSTRVSRCGRARCPHRAAAPSARCAAGQVAHVKSFACRGSVRSTVRGRAAHPARWSAAGPPGSRPTAITPANFACVLSARCARTPRPRHRRGARLCRPPSPPRLNPCKSFATKKP